MSQTYFALLTAVGEAKLANAAALGTQLQISRMAVGDGNGNLPVPSRTQTALINERYRADLNELKVDPNNASQIIAELVIPETEGGYWLREMGLYDATGALIAVSNCPPSYKPQMAEGSGRTQVLRMVLIVSSTAAVQLKIDPSVVLATREYVETTVTTRLAEEMSKLDGKNSVKVATTANLGALSGLLTVDGVVLVAGDRVLVKNQADAKDNGIYVAAAGAWSRAADADASIEVTPGLLVAVEQGTTNADSIWQLVTDAPITLGTTALAFEIAAGPSGVVAGTYRSVTVDKRGRVTGGSNPTTLQQMGITDDTPPAHISGLVLSNNVAVPTTDIDIAPGVARSASDAITLRLGSAITKRLQAAGAWAAGSGANGLFSGAKANNTWYHVFLIRKDADGTVDAGFDSSPIAANRPAAWTHYRRLGAMKTDASGNIVAFVMDSLAGRRRFRWSTPIMDVDSVTLTTAAASYTLSTPPGVKTLAEINPFFYANNAVAIFSSLDTADIAPQQSGSFTGFVGGISAMTDSTSDGAGMIVSVMTNTASQIRARGNRTMPLSILCLGWEE
ncbi:phage tail protein [Pseudomonas mosselii]|uniref:phage tail protein n=1 Tax=Pseudomonas mosselii TaxID=78327 RepID=UPI003F1C2D6C